MPIVSEILYIIILVAVLLFFLGPVDRWLRFRDRKREFKKLFGFKPAISDPEQRKKNGVEVAKKLEMLRKSKKLFGDELCELDRQILGFKQQQDLLDQSSDDWILLDIGIEDLEYEKDDIVLRLRPAEDAFEKACSLASLIGYGDEVVACKENK